jgi:hypothetical protein
MSKAYLKSQLTEEELETFKRALSQDEVIVSTILKLADYRRRSAELREDILRDPAYPFIRAYLDGRFKELKWINQLLTEGETNE